MVYFTLFITAFISATLFPMGSEAVLVYDLLQGYHVALLLFVATLGNSLGSCVNYYIGYKGEDYLEQKGYLKAEKIEKYKSYFDKYGSLALLFAWLPIVGDPLTFVAGVLKFDVKKFIVLVIISKFSRYAFLAYIKLM